MTEQIPGDGIDNDGDGLVDEEYCGFLWQGKTYSSNYDIFSWSVSNKPSKCFAFPRTFTLYVTRSDDFKSSCIKMAYISYFSTTYISLKNLILNFQIVFKNLCCVIAFF